MRALAAILLVALGGCSAFKGEATPAGDAGDTGDPAIDAGDLTGDASFDGGVEVLPDGGTACSYCESFDDGNGAFTRATVVKDKGGTVVLDGLHDRSAPSSLHAGRGTMDGSSGALEVDFPHPFRRLSCSLWVWIEISNAMTFVEYLNIGLIGADALHEGYNLSLHKGGAAGDPPRLDLFTEFSVDDKKKPTSQATLLPAIPLGTWVNVQMDASLAAAGASVTLNLNGSGMTVPLQPPTSWTGVALKIGVPLSMGPDPWDVWTDDVACTFTP